MNMLRAAFVVSAIGLFVACGGRDGGGAGGAGGPAAGGSGTAGAGGGTAGTTGAGGTQAACAACIACVNDSCATAVSECQADAACNALYECARACTFTVRDCANMHLAAAQTWISTVSSCITTNCGTPCANSI